MLIPLEPTSMPARSASMKVASPTVAFAGPMRPFPSIDEEPGFPIGIEPPMRMGLKIDPLEHEMRTCDENAARIGEAPWRRLRLRRPGVGNGDRAVLVQLALPAEIEQAECRVAALLDLGEHDIGADGVDRAGGDEDHVALRDRTPLHKARNRAVPDRCAQCLWRQMPLQSQRNLRARRRREDVPRLGFPFSRPMACANSSGRVNLDRQGLAGEQQLEQECRARRTLVDAFEPQLADRVSGSVNAAPGAQIDAAPGFAGDLYGGMLEGHSLSGSRQPMECRRQGLRTSSLRFEGSRRCPRCPRPELRQRGAGG